MVTTRSKRWNGKFDALPVEYLKEVLAKMNDYGDRVQFSLVGGGPQPSYQITSALDRKMAFDRNHHLLRPENGEFDGANATAVMTVEQITAAINGVRSGPAAAARTTRASPAVGAPRTTAARLEDQFATQRYEYFRNNRAMLPPAIAEHSDEITELMRKGKSAEEAFGEVMKKYF